MSRQTVLVSILVILLTAPAASALLLGEPLAPLPEKRSATMLQLAGPDGERMEVRVDLPWGRVGDSLFLHVGRDAAAKLDPALLNLSGLAAEGILAADGSIPVLVRARAPLAFAGLDVSGGFARLGLVTGRVALEDLVPLALDPRVERVYADGMNHADLAESVPLVRADDVWASRVDNQSRPVRGQGVRIAILDTGVDHTHPDLGGCLGAGCKVESAQNFALECANATDDYGHGTHVAATAAGAQGVAPNATILNYKVLCGGWGWDTWIIAGIENATLAGADIISMSLGGGGATDTPLAQAVDWAVEQGVVVVSAAGNWGCYGCVSEPGTSLRGITVGATTKSDALAYFSARGPVYNSSGDIVGIKPDLAAPGMDIVAAVPTGSCPLCDPSGYLSLSGTSMATPHVAGAAALLLQGHPTWTPDDVKGALMGSAVPLAYDSRTLGTGRLDALDAFDAGVSILPANAWIGVDLAGEPSFNATLPLAARNLGATTRTLALAASLGVPGAVNVTPETLTLAPGESANLTLTLALDNAVVPDGWHEGRINVSGDSTLRTRFTFVKSGLLRVHVPADTWFVQLARNGSAYDYVYPTAENFTLLAEAGEYDLQGVAFWCPPSESCGADDLTFLFAEDVVHASVTEVELVPASTFESEVQPIFEDGTTPSSMRYCGWEPSLIGCYDDTWVMFSSPEVDYAFGTGGGAGLATHHVAETNWTMGRSLTYNRGNVTYIIGNASYGVHADLVVAPTTADFLERAFRYEVPAGWTPAMRMQWCTWGSWGAGAGREILSPRERVLTAMPDLPPVQTPWGPMPAAPCQRFFQTLIGSTDGSTGTECWDGGDCWSLADSAHQKRVGNGIVQLADTWSDVLLNDSLRGGDVVLFDGAQTFEGYVRVERGRMTAYARQDWAYNSFFGPASGGTQSLHQSYDNRLTYRLLRNEVVVSEGELGGGYLSGSYATDGAMRLEVTSNGSFVNGVAGVARYSANWTDGVFDGSLARVSGLRVLGPDGLATKLPPGAAATAAFALAPGARVEGLSVAARNLATGATWTTSPVMNGTEYRVPLGDLGEGAIALTIAGRTSGNASRFEMAQTPAYLVGNGTTNRAPSVAIERPAEGATVVGHAQLEGRASDPDGNATLERVEFRVDGGPWSLANGTTRWSANTSDLAPGQHLIEARAFDGQAYSDVASVRVRAAVPMGDLVVTLVEVVREPLRTSYGNVTNDGPERRTVRAIVANVGARETSWTSVRADAHATAYAPGTTAELGTTEALGMRDLPPLAPGQRVVLEWTWDTTGNVGDHEVVVTADPWNLHPEEREDNNARAVESFVVVGGLGGAALLAPVPAGTLP